MCCKRTRNFIAVWRLVGSPRWHYLALSEVLELYQGVKRGHWCTVLVKGHPFADGNKRVVHAAMMIFLASALSYQLADAHRSKRYHGGVLYRAIIAEERAFVTMLGDHYVDYMRKTKRFLPFLV